MARKYGSGGNFTLIELLVVLAIIGTLVGLVIPAVRSAAGVPADTKSMPRLSQ